MGRPRCCCTGRSGSSRSSSRRRRGRRRSTERGDVVTERTVDFEQLLRQALKPVDPPDDLEERVEDRLRELAVAAAGELEGWELKAMRDPRVWPRTVAAAGVGAGA